jgi:protein O-mannosyl-transferase
MSGVASEPATRPARGRVARVAVEDPAVAAPERPLRRFAGPLALVVAVAFLPVLRNGWVDLDDDGNFLANPHYRGLGWEQVRWAWGTYHLGVYQPLAWMLLEGEYAAWGMEPRGYHLASLLLHAVNAVVLYALGLALLARCLPEHARRQPWDLHAGAALAALLFAIHPLRTEAVAWVSCQPYLPCALFAMLSVLMYLRADQGAPSRRLASLVGAWIFFAVALLFKAAAVGVPAVLVILDIYPLRRLGPGRWAGREARRAWVEKLPFVGLGLVFMVLAVRAKGASKSLLSGGSQGPVARVVRSCVAAWTYPAKTLLPIGLNAYDAVPLREGWCIGTIGICLLLTVAAVAGLFFLRRWPGLVAACAGSLLLVAPNLGLVRVSDVIAADRYAYVASIPWALLLAGVLVRLGRDGGRRRLAVVAGAAGLVLVLLPLTWRQCRTWRDSEALWTNALACDRTGNADLVINVGTCLSRRGRLDEAIDHFEEALRREPGAFRAHSGLGSALARLGRFDEAASHYRAALRLKPDLPLAHAGLGAVRIAQGRLDEAIARCREALRLAPEAAEAHCNLGVALARQGRLAEARAEFDRALQIEPGNANAHYNLGRLLAEQGRLEEAAAEAEAALDIDPNSAQAKQLLLELVGRWLRKEEGRKPTTRHGG